MHKLVTLLLLILIVTGCSDKPINKEHTAKYRAEVEFPTGVTTEYRVKHFTLGSDRFIHLILEDGTTLRVPENKLILFEIKGE